MRKQISKVLILVLLLSLIPFNTFASGNLEEISDNFNSYNNSFDSSKWTTDYQEGVWKTLENVMTNFDLNEKYTKGNGKGNGWGNKKLLTTYYDTKQFKLMKSDLGGYKTYHIEFDIKDQPQTVLSNLPSFLAGSESIADGGVKIGNNVIYFETYLANNLSLYYPEGYKTVKTNFATDPYDEYKMILDFEKTKDSARNYNMTVEIKKLATGNSVILLENEQVNNLDFNKIYLYSGKCRFSAFDNFLITAYNAKSPTGFDIIQNGSELLASWNYTGTADSFNIIDAKTGDIIASGIGNNVREKTIAINSSWINNGVIGLEIVAVVGDSTSESVYAETKYYEKPSDFKYLTLTDEYRFRFDFEQGKKYQLVQNGSVLATCTSDGDVTLSKNVVDLNSIQLFEVSKEEYAYGRSEAADGPTEVTQKNGPVLSDITQPSTSTILLNWSSVNGAVSYNIYKSSDNQIFVNVGSTTNNSLTVNLLEGDYGNQRYYRVTAVFNNQFFNESKPSNSKTITFNDQYNLFINVDDYHEAYFNGIKLSNTDQSWDEVGKHSVSLIDGDNLIAIKGWDKWNGKANISGTKVALKKDDGTWVVTNSTWVYSLEEPPVDSEGRNWYELNYNGGSWEPVTVIPSNFVAGAWSTSQVSGFPSGTGAQYIWSDDYKYYGGDVLFDSPVYFRNIIDIPNLVSMSTLNGTIENGVISLDWSPISNVKKYYVEKSYTEDFANVESISEVDYHNSTYQYTLTGAEYDKTIYYRVRAEMDGYNTPVYSAYSNIKSFSEISSIKNLDAHLTVDKTQIEVTWDAVDNALSYELVYYEQENEENSTIVELTELTFTKDLTVADIPKTYVFKLRAKISEEVYTDYLIDTVTTENPYTVTNLRGTMTDTSFVLNWDSLQNVDGYNIYKSYSSDPATFEKLDLTATENSKTITIEDDDRENNVYFVVSGIMKSGMLVTESNLSNVIVLSPEALSQVSSSIITTSLPLNGTSNAYEAVYNTDFTLDYEVNVNEEDEEVQNLQFEIELGKNDIVHFDPPVVNVYEKNGSDKVSIPFNYYINNNGDFQKLLISPDVDDFGGTYVVSVKTKIVKNTGILTNDYANYSFPEYQFGLRVGQTDPSPLFEIEYRLLETKVKAVWDTNSTVDLTSETTANILLVSGQLNSIH